MPRPMSGSMGHAKHHVAFGKGNRNPRNNQKLAQELNALTQEQQLMKERRKSKMLSTIKELFHK